MSPDMILAIQILARWLIVNGSLLFLGTVTILIIYNLFLKGKINFIEKLLD